MSNWKWGFIYHSKTDPRFIVPERLGIGWTVNFAQPLGWAYVVFSCCYLMIPFFIMYSEKVPLMRFAVSMVGLVAILTILTWWLNRVQRR